MDKRSNAYGAGGGWPPAYGADVAYPTDEHPSYPPTPWASAPVDPSAWAPGPGGGPGWDASAAGSGWEPDAGAWPAGGAEPAWGQGAPQGQGYPQGQAYDQTYGYDQGYGQAPPSPAGGQSWPETTAGRDGAWSDGAGGRQPWPSAADRGQPGAWPPADPGTGYAPGQPGQAGPAWVTDPGQAARATGHDLGPITGPEWPAVPRDAAGSGYAAGGYAPAQDPQGQAWSQGGPGYETGYETGYGSGAEPAAGWDQRAGQGWDQGGPGYAQDQTAYAQDQTAYAGQQGWNQEAQEWGNQSQEWEQAAGDQGGWDNHGQGGWGNAAAAPPAAAPGWGPRDQAADGAEWEDGASFDAAFGDADDPWGPGEADGERPRPRRGLVLILAVALVVLLGAVAGATWALTTRNAGTADQPAGAEAPAGDDDGGQVAGGGSGETGGAQETAAKQVQTEDFSFGAPKDWQDITERARSDSSVGSRVVTALARTRDDGTGSSIVVTAGANETGNEPSIAALGAALKSRTESEGATKVSDPKPLNLADGDAVAVDYEGQLRGAPIAGRRVLTIHGDKAYVLVMEGSKDRFEGDLAAFDEVLASWNWTK